MKAFLPFMALFMYFIYFNATQNTPRTYFLFILWRHIFIMSFVSEHKTKTTLAHFFHLQINITHLLVKKSTIDSFLA